MQLKLRNVQGEIVGDIDVRDDVFGMPMNTALVHQVMVGQLANARQGTVQTKTRAQVSGGGRKPRPQKGTGAARLGSTRAPHVRGGGLAFGPNQRSYRHRTPKRMRRLSLITVLSDKMREDELVILDNLVLEQMRTKEMKKVLNALGVNSSGLLVADGADASVVRCASNIPKVKTLPASLLNTVDLLKYRKLVLTIDAVRKVEEIWGGGLVRRKETSPTAPIEDQ